MPTENGPAVKPALVRVCEAAIAAGTCGHPLAVYFQDYPAPNRTLLWNWFARRLNAEGMTQVGGSGDLSALAGRLSEVRLVLVHNPRLHDAVARLIAYESRPDRPAPAVFSAGPATDLGDNPGATLVAHGHQDTVAGTTAWLWDRRPDPEPAFAPAPNPPPQFDARLEPVCRPITGATRLRDALVLRGLLAGAWRLRADSGAPEVRVRPDYERVRFLLNDPVFSPADDPVHPLAAAMVGRANAYLAHVRVHRPAPSEAERDPDTEAITRSELVDLGDPQGPAVRGLVGALLTAPSGLAAFRDIGTARELTAPDWPARDFEKLAELLLPWSPKQVRTTFERLLREGLIRSRGRARNQPHRYLLPDRLRPLDSRFHRLPKPDEVEAAPFAPAGPPTGAGENPELPGGLPVPSAAGPVAPTFPEVTCDTQ